MTAFVKIVGWLLLAVQAWGAPVRKDARAEADADRMQIALDIASVVYDPAEPPLYRGPDGRARTGMLLASIGALETRFVERIVRGHCHPHECDGGLAVGLLQIHAGPFGIAYRGTGAMQCTAKSDECLSAADLARSVPDQVRMGLHILRTQGLSGFTGEGAEEGPAATARRAQAEGWVKAHPPPVLDGAVALPTGTLETAER